MTADAIEVGSRSVRLRWLAAAVVLAITAFRVAYLLFWCPYDLAPDEGHYWDWSRHLDWSYYSKGPLVAWIIRAGCELFGNLSVECQGTLMPAVRIPAVLCGGALLAGLYVLTYQTFRNDRLSFAAMLVAVSLPPFAACSVLMTIDAPFLCCWMWALVFGRRALVDGKSWAWPVVGGLVALGILAKYTMALWLFSAGLFVLFTPTNRGMLARPGFWVMAAVAALSAVPILWWNSRHDWVTFRHVAVQAGVAETKSASGEWWKGPLEFVGGQFAILLGYWFIAWAGALVRFWPRRQSGPGLRYLWWMSVPTFAVFALSSLRAKSQVNWPVAAYLSGAVLVAGWLSEQLNSRRRAWRWLTRGFFGLAVGLGLVLTFFAHDTRMVSRLILNRLPPETEVDPLPLRKLDPAARLKGYRHLGSELDRMRQSVEAADGVDPVLVGVRWDMPGLLGFYTRGHPQAYSIGLALGVDRHSQYDLWHPNPVDDVEDFKGRTFLVVAGGDATAALRPAFASVAVPEEVVYREHGRPLARWYVFVCRGYKGFDHRPGAAAGH